jgi:dienelactone hydrolase
MSTQPALTVLGLAQGNRFDEIREMFAPNLRALVAADALRAAWTAELAKIGAVTAIGAPISEAAGPDTMVVRVLVTGEHGAMTLVVSIADGDWLTGLQLAPAAAAEPVAPWQAPSYVDELTFVEAEVTVGTGPLALPGTVTRPRAAGPYPGVVLLAGSGPNDRDGTVGRNKLLKDLAWGLASRGIAVLRFDKVTVAHRAEVAGRSDFTPVDEYVNPAIAALDLLGGQPGVDPARLFLLGHSQGGSLAPRIAAAVPAVRGLVLLAGGAVPIQWSAIRQVRHLASLAPGSEAAAQPTIDALTRQAELVDSPELSLSTPNSELPFGAPAAYWLDLRGYDPVAAAAALDRPILIVHGGRDYQVTTAEDLAAWQAGLSGRANVTVRVYAADNHFFFAGEGPSTPAEMEPAQHMDPAVVTDIAAWIQTV